METKDKRSARQIVDEHFAPTELNDKIHELRNQLAKEIAEHILMALKRNGIIVSESFVTSIHRLVDQSIEIKLNR